MTVVLEKKKAGGPYTKDERIKRQNKVHKLYFECGYPATKISEIMNVNRNTINEDIKWIYANIKEELRQDSEKFLLKQIGRLESQRTRIVKSVTKEDFVSNVKHEKLLLDVDVKINDLLIKISSSSHTELENKVQETAIKDFVLYLLIKHSKDHRLSKE